MHFKAIERNRVRNAGPPVAEAPIDLEVSDLPHSLKHVDADRRPGRFARWYAALAATRPARVISRHVNWKLDPWLLRRSRGRFSSTLVFPTDVLETRGAKSGKLRRNAVIYFHDGDRVIIVASNAGAPRHPAWYHNLRAHPEVIFGGAAMHAREVRDAGERERLEARADHVFPAFATYRRDAARLDRRIPIIELTPADASRQVRPV
jgi:deazaflavin-dependent oxidoreductase (nitroreductase family)